MGAQTSQDICSPADNSKEKPTTKIFKLEYERLRLFYESVSVPNGSKRSLNRERFLVALFPEDRTLASKFYALLDPKGNGNISCEEFCEKIAYVTTDKGTSKYIIAFMLLDRNSDGAIDKSELVNFLCSPFFLKNFFGIYEESFDRKLIEEYVSTVLPSEDSRLYVVDFVNWAVTSPAIKLLFDHIQKTSNKVPLQPVKSVDASKFFIAVANGDLDLVKDYLSKDKTVLLAVDFNNRKALHMAAEEGHLEIVKLLIQSGMDVNLQETEGWSALHYSCRKGHVSVVHFLLLHGASVDLGVGKNRTLPIHFYVSISLNKLKNQGIAFYLATLSLMLQKNLNLINARNRQGETPLHFACLHGCFPLVHFLLLNGADPSIQTTSKMKYWYQYHDANHPDLNRLKKLIEEGKFSSKKFWQNETTTHKSHSYANISSSLVHHSNPLSVPSPSLSHPLAHAPSFQRNTALKIGKPKFSHLGMQRVSPSTSPQPSPRSESSAIFTFDEETAEDQRKETEEEPSTQIDQDEEQEEVSTSTVQQNNNLTKATATATATATAIHNMMMKIDPLQHSVSTGNIPRTPHIINPLRPPRPDFMEDKGKKEPTPTPLAENEMRSRRPTAKDIWKKIKIEDGRFHFMNRYTEVELRLEGDVCSVNLDGSESEYHHFFLFDDYILLTTPFIDYSAGLSYKYLEHYSLNKLLMFDVPDEAFVNVILVMCFSKRKVSQIFMMKTSLPETKEKILHHFYDIYKDGWRAKPTFEANTSPQNQGEIAIRSGKHIFWKKYFCQLKNETLWLFSSYWDSAPEKHIPLHQYNEVVVDESKRWIILRHNTSPHVAKKIIQVDSTTELHQWQSWFSYCITRRPLSNLSSQSSTPLAYSDYDSFAPERSLNQVRYFIDGCSYMEVLADALLSAKTDIYITDWSMNPEVYLRRKPPVSPDDRLDLILKKKANQGIMIYVLLWNEVGFAMGGSVNSSHARRILENLHPTNIKVLQHPQIRTQLFWSHHQKLVVIDQKEAFIGGIDLCFGRWDDPKHDLVDRCYLSLKFPGKDYYNPSFVEFNNLQDPYSELVERDIIPRMPWHDIHCQIEGKAAEDAAINFIRRWNHHVIGMDDASYTPLYIRIHSLDLDYDVFQRPIHSSKSPSDMIYASKRGISDDWAIDKKTDDSNPLYYEGLDNQSLIEKDSKTPTEAEPKSLSKSGSAVRNVDMTKRSALRSHLVNPNLKNLEKYSSVSALPEINHQLDQSEKESDLGSGGGIGIGSGSGSGIESPEGTEDSIGHSPSSGESVDDKSEKKAFFTSTIMGRIGEKNKNRLTGKSNCQVLRSIASWSGEKITETSIYKCILDLIKNAQHYIYIENQFFISSQPENGIENLISDEIYERIRLSVVRKETFRVFVVLPVHPSGPWQLPANQQIMKWQFETICRGKKSLIERIVKICPNFEEKIIFCNLRNYDILNDEYVTEQIYVHSKLMIVDDRHVLVGSANFNDRSLRGDRDSELAVVIRDTKMIETKMNGAPFLASKFAFELRKELWQEHLGLEDDGERWQHQLTDPVCAETYFDLWLETARSNTRLFNAVFHLPNNTTETLEAWKKAQSALRKHIAVKATDVRNSNTQNILSKIRGHLVLFPIHFLKNESFSGIFSAAVPMSVFQ